MYWISISKCKCLKKKEEIISFEILFLSIFMSRKNYREDKLINIIINALLLNAI